MRPVSATSGLKAYRAILSLFDRTNRRHNHNFEIQDLLLRLPLSGKGIGDLRDFLDFLCTKHPETLGKGFRKAERAYVRTGDRITKPSYIRRLRSFPDYSRRSNSVRTIDQVRSVAKGFCAEPNASYHVVSIFRPIDLVEKFRPGYVPCVVSADFKYRDGKLSGKFFFRSCDGFNLFPFDLLYCASILEQLYEEIIANHFSEPLEFGEMVFWFSRIYVSRFDIDKCDTLLRTIDEFTAKRYLRPSRSIIAAAKRKQRAHIALLNQ